MLSVQRERSFEKLLQESSAATCQRLQLMDPQAIQAGIWGFESYSVPQAEDMTVWLKVDFVCQ